MKKGTIAFVLLLVTVLLFGCGGTDHTGEAKTPSPSKDMKGKQYEDVQIIFEENGFTNIKTEKIEDLITGWLTKDGEVEEVSVGGDTEYTSGNWVKADIEVIIRYHTFPPKETKAAETVAETIAKEKEAETTAEETKAKETETVTKAVETQTTEVETVKETETTEVETTEKEAIIYTVDNCEELAELLTGSTDDKKTKEFAGNYRGETIQFDGSIDYLTNVQNYKTRFDILLSSGDYNEEHQDGPTMKFEEVTAFDMDLEGSISQGDNVTVTAVIKKCDSNTGILYLDPIKVVKR